MRQKKIFKPNNHKFYEVGPLKIRPAGLKFPATLFVTAISTGPFLFGIRWGLPQAEIGAKKAHAAADTFVRFREKMKQFGGYRPFFAL